MVDFVRRFPYATCQAVLAQRITPDLLVDQSLLIDGYNLLTTIEAALAGAVILHGRDDAYRDLCDRFIVVSGDLVQGIPANSSAPLEHLAAQYGQAENFLVRLVDSFLGGERNRVIIQWYVVEEEASTTRWHCLTLNTEYI